MKMRPRKIICTTVALISLALFFTGCAQRMQSVRENSLTDDNGQASLQAIKVSEDGYQVEISASKPLTYTFYKVTSPLKVVVDLSQTDPGAITSPIEVNAGNVKRIEVTRHGFGQYVLSRVEISLANNGEFTVNTDSDNRSKLLVTFVKPQPEQVATKAEARVEEKQLKVEDLAPPAPAQAKIEEKQVKAEEKQVKNEESQPKPDEIKPSPATVEGNGGEKQAAPVAKDVPKAAAEQKAKVLTAINVVPDGVEIVVPGGVDTFNSFRLTRPLRLVLDIPGAKSSLAAKSVAVKSFGIDKARVGLSPDKVRIVFDSAQNTLLAYRIDKSENGLKVLLKGVPPAPPVKTAAEAAREPVAHKTQVTPAVKEPVAQKAQEAPAAKAVIHKISSVEAIDFKSVEGYSLITVKVSGACNAEKPKRSANGWVLTIKNCQLPRKLQRMLDTSAFASAVKEITPYQVRIRGGYETKLLVKLRSDAPFNFSQEGDTVAWSIKNPEMQEKPVAMPVAAKPQPAPALAAAQTGKGSSTLERELVGEKQVTGGQSTDKKKGYTGRWVTLEFSDADVRKIFQLIAEVSNLNFLIADDVTGTISLKLVNVPWDQALDVILDSKNLEMKREGNIVQIKPKGKFKTQEQEEAEAKREHEKRLEMITRVFDVNFAALGDMEKQFRELSSKLPGTSIISDARTNKIIVIDNETRLKNMEDLLAKLDVPEKQVMIEARIVEAGSTFTRDLGVQWGIHYKDGSSSFLGINQLDTGFGGILTQTPPPVGFQPFDSAGGAMGLSFGKLTSNFQLDMRLSAAATAGLVKIISSPKVVTLNNKAAKISQGQSIPYQTTSAEGTKTQFVDATLSLEVTPHITADGSIGMKITASNNSAAAAPPGIAPAINKKEATTELQVMNGETTVIGGIFVDSDSETNSGVPFLMDIPLLGWMFKSNSKTKTKTELLIFITPRVVGQGIS